MPTRPVIATAVLLLFLAVPFWSETPSPSAKDQAQSLVSIGLTKVHLVRLSEAQADCDAALKLDPANQAAKDCLDRVADLLIEQDLNSADAKLLSGDKAGAIQLAAKWAWGAARPEQQARARSILQRAQSLGAAGILKTVVPDWLRQFLLTIVTLTWLALVLLVVRKFWREWKRAEMVRQSHEHDQMEHAPAERANGGSRRSDRHRYGCRAGCPGPRGS